MGLQAEGHGTDLWAVQLVSAADVTSIHAACSRLDELASEETIREALHACLPESLHPSANSTAPWSAGALRRRRRLAIDLTLIPSHGEPFRAPGEYPRGREISGRRALKYSH